MEIQKLDALSIADLVALKSFFLEIVANDKQVKNGVANDRKEFLENEIERLEFLVDQIESEIWARIEPLENWAEKVLKSKKA